MNTFHSVNQQIAGCHWLFIILVVTDNAEICFSIMY